MSSFWDWENGQVDLHLLVRPYSPENGQPLKFKPGCPVIYTNDEGVESHHIVTGYYLPATPDAHYALGCRYMLSWECYWFPVTESSLRPDPTRTVLFYEAKSYCRRVPDWLRSIDSCCVNE